MQSYIDAHTHISALTMENLASMYLAGVRTVISPVQLGCGRPLQPETIADVWYAQFEKQFPRCRASQIRPYAMIGVSMVAVPARGLDRLLLQMEELLAREDVLAIGEVGFEPNSASNPDHGVQKELLVRQIELAKKYNKVLNIHTPHAPKRKLEAAEEALALCAAGGLAPEKIVVDHCGEEILPLVLDSGANAAISVQPWRNVTPELAADWVLRHPGGRVLIDSDCSELLSDPLALPKTAAALSRRGASEELIDAVCGANAARIYGIV